MAVIQTVVMHHRRIFLVLFSLSLTAVANCQDMLGVPKREYSTKDPAVSDFKKYVDLPIGHFTGSPSISIPVYTVKSKSIEVPITLNYQAGGILVEQNPSTVGLGWTLSAGGSITRSVRGHEDDGYLFELEQRMSRVPRTMGSGYDTVYDWFSSRDRFANISNLTGGAYFDGYSVTGNSFLSDIQSHNNTITSGGFPSGDNPLISGVYDTEPDIFHFNFGAYSGKFYLSAYGPIIVPHNSDLKIAVVTEDRTHIDIWRNADGNFIDTIPYRQFCITSFKVSTPDGKDYYFGETENSRTKMTGAQWSYSARNLYTAWSLTKIVDRMSADSIVFTYDNHVRGNPGIRNDQSFHEKGDVFSIFCPQPTVPEIQNNEISTLTGITSSSDHVVFYTNVFVDSIRVFDRVDSVSLRKFQFTYGAGVSGKSRLIDFLEIDRKLNLYETHQFRYHDETTYSGLSSQDFWGFYNGAPNNGKLALGVDTCGGRPNRYPAWPAMKQDALTGITYPGGGRAEIEYEPHKVNAGRVPNGGVQEGDGYNVGQGLNFSLIHDIIGGLRVKELRHIDPVTNDTLFKRFKYNKFGVSTSSGFVHVPPLFTVEIDNFPCPNGPVDSYWLSTHNLFQGNGSHVTYQNVTVEEGKNGALNGYTEFEFYDDMNTDSSFYLNAITDSTNYAVRGVQENAPQWMPVVVPDNLLSGKLKVKRTYSASNLLLAKEEHAYQTRNYNQWVYGHAIKTISSADVCNDGGGLAVTGFRSGHAGSGHIDIKWAVFDDEWENGIGVDYKTNELRWEILTGPKYDGIAPRFPPGNTFYYKNTYRISKIGVFEKSVINSIRGAGNDFIADTVHYYYENPAHSNVTRTERRDGQGRIVVSRNFFTLDFKDVNNGDSLIYFMKKASVNVPLASVQYKDNVISGSRFRKYALFSRSDSTAFKVTDEYELERLNEKLPFSLLNIGSVLPYDLNFPQTYFKHLANFRYGSDKNISSASSSDGANIVLLHDYQNKHAVAQFMNADSADVAYTSFETSYRGNWSVSGGTISGIGVMGRRALQASGATITRAGLNAAKRYKVSYWSSSGSMSVNGQAGTIIRAENGWNCYEHLLAASVTSVTITGSAVIDELRLLPTGSSVKTFTFDPLTGVTGSNDDNNNISRFEYDGLGRMLAARDGESNIVKKAEYYQNGFQHDSAVWRFFDGTSRFQVCPADTNYTSNIVEYLMVDINPLSPSYRQLSWAALRTITGMDLSVWQATDSIRCLKYSNNENTGYAEAQEMDMNPCSATYGQVRWYAIGQSQACPPGTPPPPPCTGPDKMTINGVCVTGTKIYTASVYDNVNNTWSCKFHYSFGPDCIKSIDYYEPSPGPCMPSPPCTPM